MQLRYPAISALILLLSKAARADTLTTSTGPYEGTINGLKDGKITMSTRGGERAFDPEEIKSLAFDKLPKFTEAEEARGDALKASKLYRDLIPTLNKPEFKQLAELRAIGPLEEQGLWTDAVRSFLDVYQANPTEGIWKLHPAHFPAAGSRLLGESAKLVAAAVSAAKTDEARKNLQTYLLEIYTHAGDTAAAERLARQMSGQPDVPASARVAPDVGVTAALGDLETALRDKNYERVLTQTDALLATWRGEAAVGLFSLRARALEGQGQAEKAAAAWLRIVAHYPDSPEAPAALQRAAALEEGLKHGDAAKALREELQRRYAGAGG